MWTQSGPTKIEYLRYLPERSSSSFVTLGTNIPGYYTSKIRVIDIDWPAPVKRVNFVDVSTYNGAVDLTNNAQEYYELPAFTTRCKINAGEPEVGYRAWSILLYMQFRDDVVAANGRMGIIDFGGSYRDLCGINFFEDISYSRYGDVEFTIRTELPRFYADGTLSSNRDSGARWLEPKVSSFYGQMDLDTVPPDYTGQD